tara:strand:- start:729 stop:1277 length:549 start_codon:yes stop_codon:yes gene_type:complete
MPSPNHAGQKMAHKKLITVPHIHDIFKDNEMNYELCSQYVTLCESKLNKYLRSRQLPDPELMNDIAIAKIKCVEDSIKFVHLLQNEIGSYALMELSGFGHRDFLTCCKFAEGDSRILMRKLAREQLKKYKKNIMSNNKQINDMCFNIVKVPQHDVRMLYELADMIINETLINKNMLYRQSKL